MHTQAFVSIVPTKTFCPNVVTDPLPWTVVNAPLSWLVASKRLELLLHFCSLHHWSKVTSSFVGWHPKHPKQGLFFPICRVTCGDIWQVSASIGIEFANQIPFRIFFKGFIMSIRISFILPTSGLNTWCPCRCARLLNEPGFAIGVVLTTHRLLGRGKCAALLCLFFFEVGMRTLMTQVKKIYHWINCCCFYMRSVLWLVFIQEWFTILCLLSFILSVQQVSLKKT